MSLTVEQLEPLMAHWFGLDACKGWHNPERLTNFVNDAIALAASMPTAHGCRWPLCEPEAVQEEIAAEVHRRLYTG